MKTMSHAAASAILSFTLTAVKEVQKAVETAAKAPGASSKTKMFLNLLVPLFSHVTVRLEEFGEAGCSRGSDIEKEVLKLLIALETLVRWPGGWKPPANLPFSRDDYPSLNCLIRGVQKPTTTSLRRLAKSTHMHSNRERKKFQKSFIAFANVTQSPPRGPPLKKLLKFGAKPAECDDYTACLRVLYATLCYCSPQGDGCGGSFMTNVALTREHGLEKTKDDVPFDLFFLHRHPGSVDDMWKEVRIRVFLQGDGTRPASVKWVGSRTISPEEFCALIRRRHRGRLVLNAASDGLVYERLELNLKQLERLYLLNASSVSLATVLEKRKLHGNDKLKVLLSYLLAKAVWQFYDSDWMRTNWSKNDIHFMRECLNGQSVTQGMIALIHKPYFATELAPQFERPAFASQSECPTEQNIMHRFPSATHRYPKILALGIMLLEIELGEGIEHHRLEESLKSKDPIENDDQFTAYKIVVSPMWKRRNVYQAVREMINICLQPDLHEFGTNEAAARDYLFNNVVAPLGQLFEESWSHDGDPELFEPDPISFRETEVPLNDVNSPQPSSVATGYPSSIQTPVLNTTVSVPILSKLQAVSYLHPSLNNGEIHSENDSKIENRQKQTDQWFSNFQKLIVTHRLLGRSHEERLKVAILDSGINTQHSDFSDEDRERIRGKVSFIDSKAETDFVGHGTHIAAVILRLTKNVDLYIAKITDSPKGCQRKDIIEALEYARTQWRVQMITISFGFDSVQSPDIMGQEIRQCLHEGIMVFASASNDGGEGSRTYPAKYDKVICAHSATCQGSKAERNPGLEEDRNFSFVGEHSGTSYAAPVAVAVAAFMIGYIQKKMPGHAWVIKPWSPEGILIIFKLMATNIDGYELVSPTRYLKYTEEDKIRGDLQQYLK
ncbi:hypothetical protein F4808DRAFT_473817 [Astrocystis sublimbata]|nr:hypothetical protein F4808DRAFT_473817 [Astrocystis sublimbata]